MSQRSASLNPAGFPSRLSVLGLASALATAVIVFYGREATGLLLAVIATETVVQLAYWAVCVLLGRMVVRRLARESVDSAFGIASSAAMGFALVGMVVLALGLAGWLSSASGWAVLSVAAAAGLWDVRKVSLAAVDRRVLGAWLRARSEGNWIWLMLAAGMAVSVVGASLMPGALWPDDPHPYDSLVYHLQVPREWFEAGRIVPLHHNVFSFFPFNVEIHYLLADYLRGGPWAAAYQAQFLSVAMTLMAEMVLWGWVRARASRRAAALAVAAFTTLPWVVMLSCVSYVESGMLLFGALAIGWFLTAMGAAGTAKRSFVLAGLFAGLACGVKLTNVPILLGALPVAGVVAWLVSRQRALRAGQLLGGCVLMVLCGLLTLSPWLVRNTVWAGNPVFPVAMRQLGQAHFSDTQVERFERAHRPAAAHADWWIRLQRAAGEIAINWRYGYVLLPLGLIISILRWREVEARVALLLIAMLLVFWLTSTHLMGRFFVLGIIPATMMLSLLSPRMITAAAVGVAAAAALCLIGPAPWQSGAGSARSVYSIMEPNAAHGRQGLFGLEDYSPLMDPELLRMLDRTREVVFVGDAQMFLRQAPMQRLHYSTVFDLDTDAGRGWIDASYGPRPATCPSSVAVVIDGAECRRLAATYYQVPTLTPPVSDRFQRVLVVRP